VNLTVLLYYRLSIVRRRLNIECPTQQGLGILKDSPGLSQNYLERSLTLQSGELCFRRFVLLNPSTITVSSNFHSLFRVLFNFPSRYLFAIGLSLVFSFRRKIPPILHCNIVQCDSRNLKILDNSWLRTGLSPSKETHSRVLLSKKLLYQ